MQQHNPVRVVFRTKWAVIQTGQSTNVTTPRLPHVVMVAAAVATFVSVPIQRMNEAPLSKARTANNACLLTCPEQSGGRLCYQITGSFKNRAKILEHRVRTGFRLLGFWGESKACTQAGSFQPRPVHPIQCLPCSCIATVFLQLLAAVT